MILKQSLSASLQQLSTAPTLHNSTPPNISNKLPKPHPNKVVACPVDVPHSYSEEEVQGQDI